MQKLLTFFFSQTISIYAIFNGQSFNDTLTIDIVSFEQLGPGITTITEHSLPMTPRAMLNKLNLSFPSFFSRLVHPSAWACPLMQIGCQSKIKYKMTTTVDPDETARHSVCTKMMERTYMYVTKLGTAKKPTLTVHFANQSKAK